MDKTNQVPCGFLPCVHCHEVEGCQDTEINSDCEEWCDFYRSAEEWKEQEDKYGPYRGFNIEFQEED